MGVNEGEWMREGLKNYQIHQPGYYWNKTCMIWGSSGIYSFVIRMSSGKLKTIPLFASLKCWLDRFVANSFLNIYTIHKNPVILVGKPSKKKNFQTVDIVQTMGGEVWASTNFFPLWMFVHIFNGEGVRTLWKKFVILLL